MTNRKMCRFRKQVKAKAVKMAYHSTTHNPTKPPLVRSANIAMGPAPLPGRSAVYAFNQMWQRDGTSTSP